jgi:GATA-binding protein
MLGDKKRLSPSNQLQNSPGFVPLLPRNDDPLVYEHGYLPRLPPHLQQQVPLHHPSSVPTQFASNLQSITSPLLLSTTPKTTVSQHQLSQTQVAAGVLENLSMDKNDSMLRPLNLNQGDAKAKPFSPATALNGPQGAQTQVPPQGPQGPQSKPHVPAGPPTLSNLMNPVSGFYSSPSFGPQHSLTNPSAFSLTTGPPSNPPTAPSSHENKEEDTVASLKTRISELELVNDLYKSRIQELESLEQVSRQRETELKGKLDELENEHERKRVKVENGNQ